jgi:hypothetical protein
MRLTSGRKRRRGRFSDGSSQSMREEEITLSLLPCEERIYLRYKFCLDIVAKLLLTLLERRGFAKEI